MMMITIPSSNCGNDDCKTKLTLIISMFESDDGGGDAEDDDSG